MIRKIARFYFAYRDLVLLGDDRVLFYDYSDKASFFTDIVIQKLNQTANVHSIQLLGLTLCYRS